LDSIEKFPFISDSPASDVGELTEARGFGAGQSSIRQGYGYVSGGLDPNRSPTSFSSNVIDKFPFTSDTPASGAGDLSFNIQQGAGQSSLTNGYHTTGLFSPGCFLERIEEFPFAEDVGSTCVGSLSPCARVATGQSSETHGYKSGGGPLQPVFQSTIRKFPFANITPVSTVGCLFLERLDVSGQSSENFGYTSGGTPNTPGPGTNIIDKFPFASDTNATDVGDLTVCDATTSGHQV